MPRGFCPRYVEFYPRCRLFRPVTENLNEDKSVNHDSIVIQPDEL